MDRHQLPYLLALQATELVGVKTIKTLVAYCGSPKSVYQKNAGALKRIPGIGAVQAKNILRKKDFSLEEAVVEKISKTKIGITTYFDSDYPNRLKQLHDSPVILYHYGKAALSGDKVVAIVGTRRSTAYGRKMCRKIIEGLAKYDVVIVSGLAYGIDITAHRAALTAGVPTIGVLAFGHDKMYPLAHAHTARRMTREGGLISEYPPGTKPERENFPQRNRIIAGLSDAVVIVETDLKGGANITAEIANSYDRDVFAIPGNVDQSVAQGCHRLIKTHKAALVENAGDIAYQMGWDLLKTQKEPKRPSVPLNNDEEKVIQLILKYKQMDTDTIAYRLHSNTSKVSAILLSLECKGLLRSMPGNMYKAEEI